MTDERRRSLSRPIESVVVHGRCESRNHIPWRTDIPKRSFAVVLGAQRVAGTGSGVL